MSMYQRTEMIHHAQQLIPLSIDLLKLLQLYRSIHLLSVDNETVAAVVETL